MSGRGTTGAGADTDIERPPESWDIVTRTALVRVEVDDTVHYSRIAIADDCPTPMIQYVLDRSVNSIMELIRTDRGESK